jgi:GntR family transcriptional repressor for pyruvate dehydrogenase complex
MAEAVRTPKIAEAIAGHIEKLILEGALRPGERLLAERELAERLGVSRPSLRDAFELLTERGLLVTGKGGTQVAEFLTPLIKPLATLMQGRHLVTADYFEFRRIQESFAARFAAERATELDRTAIRDCLQKMETAHTLEDPAQESEADLDFHVMIYEASHNIVLLHVMRAMADLLRQNIFYSRSQLYLRPGVRDELLLQNMAIGDAVISAKPDEAEHAASSHIRYVFEMVEEIRRDSVRLETSMHRVKRGDLIAH